MKQIYILALLTLLCGAKPVTADEPMRPYTGINLGHSEYKFHPGFGDNLFAFHYPTVNGHVGVMLNRTVALEGGVATTLHRRREVTIREGDLVLGRSNDPLSSPKDLICTSRIYGWHADLIWTPRLLKSPKATWLFSAGVKKETFKAHKRILAIRNQPINPADQEETKIRLSSINLVARLAMGAQYFFDDHFGLRTAIVWEHSPHLTPTAFMQSTNEGVGEARLKNSFGYAIGVIVRP